jgi:hypothetical protein
MQFHFFLSGPAQKWSLALKDYFITHDEGFREPLAQGVVWIVDILTSDENVRGDQPWSRGKGFD